MTEHQKKLCLSLHCNGVTSYILVNGVEIYKFKAKDSELNAAPLCLGNVLKDFSLDNMKKRLNYMDMSLIFQFIMIILMQTNVWIY